MVVIPVGSAWANDDGSLSLGPGALLRLSASDDASGVVSIRFRWNGGKWQTYKKKEIKPPNGTELLLEYQAKDASGKWSEVDSLKVRRDTPAPETPEWEPDQD